MYYRLMNSVDLEAFEKEMLKIGLDCEVLDRVKEVIETICSAYGDSRAAFAQGGFLLFFDTREAFEDTIESLYRFYCINDSNYEYRDIIGKDGQWVEILWLLSSEDALVLVFPERI